MTDAVLDAYLARIEPRFRLLVTALHEAVLATGPELKVALKWGMLLYNLGGSYMRWVCAVSTTKSAANLRFLFGTSLSDPAHVLRGGKSHLMTWDIPSLAALDLPLVQAYVREALDGYAAALQREGEAQE